MNNKDLTIIDNEKFFLEDDNFYCDNIESKSISEGLNKFKKVYLIARKSKIKRVQKINLARIKISSNIFRFLYSIIETFRNKNINYLLISLNPFTFFSSLVLLIFKKKIFIYLRSNGYEEYKSKYGLFGKFIYHIMFTLVTPKSNLIVCQKRLTNKKDFYLVFPSQLNEKWFDGLKKSPLDKIRLLYVGRMRVEKGIFDFFKLFRKLNFNAELSIVSDTKNIENNDSRINFIGFGFDTSSLINIYDKHNIMVLPSFTEGHPQVVLESLARRRPVIIFKDIDHIVGDKMGIFISERNEKSFLKTVDFIMKNYSSIQESMVKNKLPTKAEFILQMNKILS